MTRGTTRLLVVGMIAVLASSSRANATLLLASYEFWTNGGGSPEPDPQVELVLQLPTNFPPTEFFGLGESANLFWEDGDQGSFDFTADNDPQFANFASHATNGVEELFIIWTHFPTGGGGGRATAEPELFDPSPDLAGFNLEIVRLVVTETTITPWNPDPNNDPVFDGYKFSVKGRYEFYGTPVPEPATASLMLITAAAILLPLKNRRKSADANQLRPPIPSIL